jgi:hypothetical protein
MALTRSAFARELPAGNDDRALRTGVRALREREHGMVTRAPAPGPHAVTKLLLIIDDCRISAIASLQKRHTLRDNARWETLSVRQQTLLNLHTQVAGLPSISAQRNSCLQNGLSGKRPQGLGFWASSSHCGHFVSNQIRRGLPAAGSDKFRSNM